MGGAATTDPCLLEVFNCPEVASHVDTKAGVVGQHEYGRVRVRVRVRRRVWPSIGMVG